MAMINRKKLIVSLIKDDLINTKLVESLDKLELNATEYSLHLSDTIFKLLGFPEDDSTEEDFLYYMDERKRARHLSIKLHKPFDDLAREIYCELYDRSPKAKKSKHSKSK